VATALPHIKELQFCLPQQLKSAQDQLDQKLGLLTDFLTPFSKETTYG
jgi:hypothetical protein